MPDLQVIYDPAKEVAVIVDLENYVTLPMAGPGESFAVMLQSFIDSTPFDLTELSADSQLAAFMSFLDRYGDQLAVAPDANTDVATGDVGDATSDSDAALAEREAANATDAPAEQPADADMEADAGKAHSLVDPTLAGSGGVTGSTTESVESVIGCPNCNGTGTIAYGDGVAPEQCRMCKGTRKVTISVPA